MVVDLEWVTPVIGNNEQVRYKLPGNANVSHRITIDVIEP